MELNLKVTKESHYATGKRKESVARVWVLNGSGKISVNGKIYTEKMSYGFKAIMRNFPKHKDKTSQWC